MMWRRWNYRVRDCKTRTTAYCETLEQALRVAEMILGDVPTKRFLVNLLEQGESVTDGHRYKVDVRGKYCDKSWEI